MSTIHAGMTGCKGMKKAPLLKVGMHAEMSMCKSRPLSCFFGAQSLSAEEWESAACEEQKRIEVLASLLF